MDAGDLFDHEGSHLGDRSHRWPRGRCSQSADALRFRLIIVPENRGLTARVSASDVNAGDTPPRADDSVRVVHIDEILTDLRRDG